MDSACFHPGPPVTFAISPAHGTLTPAGDIHDIVKIPFGFSLQWLLCMPHLASSPVATEILPHSLRAPKALGVQPCFLKRNGADGKACCDVAHVYVTFLSITQRSGERTWYVVPTEVRHVL